MGKRTREECREVNFAGWEAVNTWKPIEEKRGGSLAPGPGPDRGKSSGGKTVAKNSRKESEKKEEMPSFSKHGNIIIQNRIFEGRGDDYGKGPPKKTMVKNVDYVCTPYRTCYSGCNSEERKREAKAQESIRSLKVGYIRIARR